MKKNKSEKNGSLAMMRKHLLYLLMLLNFLFQDSAFSLMLILATYQH